MQFIEDLFAWLKSYFLTFCSMSSSNGNGTWWLRSEIDPRWNRDGRGFVGGLDMPAECEQVLEKLLEEHKEAPPDLTWGRKYD